MITETKVSWVAVGVLFGLAAAPTTVFRLVGPACAG